MLLPQKLQEEYPFEPNWFLQKDGLNLHYIDDGPQNGYPTFFLHGNPTWSFFYRKLILSLKTNLRCIAPDHLGCGLSDKPQTEKFSYNLLTHSENFKALIDKLAIKKFNLVVHDWGGAIGLTALKDDFHKINKLVLLNTAAFPSKQVPKRIKFCRLPWIGEFFVRALNGFAKPATKMATEKGLSPLIKSGFLYPYKNWNERVAVWNFVKDIPLESNHPTLPLLKETSNSLGKLSKVPVIACWGMQDFCFHSGFLREWETRLPQMKTYEFNSAGHYLLEDEFEKCSTVIDKFLVS